MKNLLTFLILTLMGFTFAQAESRCFQNDALKGTQFVNLETNGKRVSGTFEYENGESELAKVYKFSGTMSGEVLSIKFENGEVPDVAPSEMRDFNWRLLKSGKNEVLRIKFYGKNYETNKYADYFADFEPCEVNYGLLAGNAQNVQFDKGKTSAKIPLSFKSTTERKVFSLNMRSGQTLTIDAAGSKISIYLPDGKIYEIVEWENGDEKTFASSMIDRLVIKPIPQTGNYLVVLSKMADAAQPDSVTFKITK